jgi:hypothetical protein
MPRLNVLYLGINYLYFNPNPMLLPAALTRHCSVHFFGPGFSSTETLTNGIDEFAESIGCIDIIVVTNSFAGDYSADRLNKFLTQFASFKDTLGVTTRLLNDVRNFLLRNKHIVVISLLDSDLYAISQATLDVFMAHGTYFIAPREGCFEFTHADLKKEKYISRKKSSHQFGLYHDFSRSIRSRRISLCHIVAESEFSWGPLSLRPYDVSVPGTPYFRRDSVYRQLKSYEDIILAKRSYEYVFKLASKLKLKPFSSIYTTAIYQLAFQQLLKKSKVCVTDGGLINFTIRKFFEIPAAGSLLLCWPTTDFKELGFQDKVNCFSISNSSDVIECVRSVSKDPDSFQEIVDAGQRLVMEKHSLGARSGQLHESLLRISRGSFCGSYWENGNFIFQE